MIKKIKKPTEFVNLLNHNQVWRQKNNTPQCFVIKGFSKRLINGTACEFVGLMGTLWNRREKIITIESLEANYIFSHMYTEGVIDI